MRNNLQKIVTEKPVDKIIEQIRHQIVTGQLKPGDRLLPERKLAQQLGVGRGPLRDAKSKLEFYGILKTLPQSGTMVASRGIKTLEDLITDVLSLETSDFTAIAEMRVILEVSAAQYAATRRTDDDIVALNRSMEDYEHKISEGQTAVEEDHLFHLKIAEASKNGVLKSLIMITTPDIIKNSTALKANDHRRMRASANEHRQILKYIIDKDPVLAGKTMRKHLSDVLALSTTQN